MTGTTRNIAVLDIEASGFGRGSYPIEIGVVLPNGDSHCHLIRPEQSWTHWDESAEQIHGISRELLASKGRPASEVANVLNLVLEGQTVYSDAWGFDNSWLSLLYYFAGIPQHWRLEGLNTILTEAQMEQWSTVKQEVLEELGVERHRASVDALVLQQTWKRVTG